MIASHLDSEQQLLAETQDTVRVSWDSSSDHCVHSPVARLVWTTIAGHKYLPFWVPIAVTSGREIQLLPS